MKNIITVLVLVFAFTFSAQAQKKGKKPSAEKMIQKLTTDLDLTEGQQSQIKPLLAEQMADRKKMAKARKAAKESGEKPTKEERKQQREERMAKQTAFKAKLATILNQEQLVKFEAMAKERKEKIKGKKKGKKEQE